jgi:hypothetical protein
MAIKLNPGGIFLCKFTKKSLFRGKHATNITDKNGLLDDADRRCQAAVILKKNA